MTRLLLRFLPCLAVLVAAGCSTYEKRFALASQDGAKRSPHEGAYSGRWASASHPGGGGGLRCILTKVNDSDYRADFHATWHGMSSTHSVVLHTKHAGGKPGGSARAFEGTSALLTVIGAGTYTCKGTLDGNRMRACYDATHGRGTFALKRVTSAKAGN